MYTVATRLSVTQQHWGANEFQPVLKIQGFHPYIGGSLREATGKVQY